MVQATALVNLKDHSGEWFYSVGPKIFSKSPAGVGFEPLLSALVVECKQGILKGRSITVPLTSCLTVLD